MKKILLPGCTALAAVVAFVAIAGWNRSDEPRLAITLSERELWLPPETANAKDDPGVQLHFQFEPRVEPLDARNWLTEERLTDLGFALDVMPGAPDAAAAYNRALPRIAWVALEFNGDAWHEIARRRALQPQPPHEPEHHGATREPSRLVPVDASTAMEPLLKRHPTGHLIIRAVIALGYVPPSRNGPLVYGYIRELVPPSITVPRALGDRLSTAGYDVDVAVGRLGIPYIADVRSRPQTARRTGSDSFFRLFTRGAAWQSS